MSDLDTFSSDGASGAMVLGIEPGGETPCPQVTTWIQNMRLSGSLELRASGFSKHRRRRLAYGVVSLFGAVHVITSGAVSRQKEGEPQLALRLSFVSITEFTLRSEP